MPFTYYDPRDLLLTTAFPRSGPVLGGTEVTLYGRALTPAGAFNEDAMCGFGNAAHATVSTRVTRADPAGHWLVCSPTPQFDEGSLSLGGDKEARAASKYLNPPKHH